MSDQQPPVYQPPQYAPIAPASDRYNALAIVSFVTAFFFSLAAIVTGHLALGQIKRTGERGRGLALAGLILGYAGIVFGILAFVLFVVLAIAAPDSSDPLNQY
jgi:uncharacterized membrane protein